MSFAARLINIFLAPGETFEAISEKRDWKDLWIPLIIVALVGLVSSVVLHDLAIDFNIERVEQSIENNSRIPADRKAEIIQNQVDKMLNPSPLALTMSYVSAMVATPIRAAFWALIALVIGNFILGGNAPFSHLMTASGYIYLLYVLEMIIKAPLMLYKWDMGIHTGLGLLGIGEEGTFIYTFLAGIDIFAIWRVILFGIAMGVIYKKDLKPFMIAMFIAWLVVLAAMAGLGAALM